MSRYEDEPLDMIDEDDDNGSDVENKYLIIDISGSRYGMPIANVMEIIPMPNIINLPGEDKSIRGIIKVREETYPLVDLRTIFNLQSLENEDLKMIEMLSEREKDHLAWMDELMLSVKEKREFRLTTNPHQCKFGQWYYSFKTDNLDLSIFLSNFDIPHKRIHKVGIKVQEAVKHEAYNEAEEIINVARENELKLLIELFKEVPAQIKNSHRELSIIIQTMNNQFAVSADKVVGIAEFTEENIERKRLADKSKLITGIANEKDYTCLIIDVDKLFEY